MAPSKTSSNNTFLVSPITINDISKQSRNPPSCITFQIWDTIRASPITRPYLTSLRAILNTLTSWLKNFHSIWESPKFCLIAWGCASASLRPKSKSRPNQRRAQVSFSNTQQPPSWTKNRKISTLICPLCPWLKANLSPKSRKKPVTITSVNTWNILCLMKSKRPKTVQNIRQINSQIRSD